MSHENPPGHARPGPSPMDPSLDSPPSPPSPPTGPAPAGGPPGKPPEEVPEPAGGVPPDELDRRLDVIARHPFRARFRLRGPDRVKAELHGPATLRWHAHDLIARRLAPAHPHKDGRQTPYRGHPVFPAQHATATCCRSCLRSAHGIPKDRELTRDERAYVVDVICRWIEREVHSPRP